MRVQQEQLPFIVRAIYFLFIGLWLTFIWIVIAWFFNATIILLPVGLWMINRVPQVLTLRRMPREVTVDEYRGTVVVWTRDVPQRPWIVRLLYFIFIGWWLSLIWAIVGWLLCATIIGLPLGIIMLNTLPAVTTLFRTR